MLDSHFHYTKVRILFELIYAHHKKFQLFYTSQIIQFMPKLSWYDDIVVFDIRSFISVKHTDSN